MRRALAGIAAAAALLAGCGGDGERLATLPLAAEPLGVAEAAPGEAVRRFVEAARAGNFERMAALLSAPTRATFGPGSYEELAGDFEGFLGLRVVLSRRLDDRWAVAAVAGESEEGDPAAYAAALRLEAGRWRLELGGVAFSRLRPSPLDETGREPELRAEADAGGEVERMLLWVDGRRVRSFPRRGTFWAEIRGRLERPLEPGGHVMIVFAATAETAAALAWPFEVET